MKKFLILFTMISTHLFSHSNILIEVQENSQEVAQLGAKILCQEIQSANRKNQELAIILPTGSTPIAMYEKLVSLFFAGKIDFSKIQFFNLDEYVGLGPEHAQSYAQYLENYLYTYVTPGLNDKKLELWGFKELSKRQCFNNRLRHSLNATLKSFNQDLLSAYQTNTNKLRAFDKLVEKYRDQDRFFTKLEHEFCNDKILPTLKSMRLWLEKDLSLQHYTAKRENIHKINGLASELEKEAQKYHFKLKSLLDNANCRVICFAGIGANPAHIAFNEFFLEKTFSDSKLSEEKKNNLAITCQTRLVPLCDKTRLANSRFFSKDISKVPQHAITLGFSELLSCDRIFILASGYEKKDALYKTFQCDETYRVPASLLKKHFRGDLYFIIDEASYGVGEQSSLFSLNVMDQLQLDKKEIKINSKKSPSISLWSVPSHKKPCLLDKGYKISNNQISFATLPQNKTVLWVRDNRIHYSLWQELKESKNKVYVTQKQELKELLTLIDKHLPDVIILPHSRKIVENFSSLKDEISKKYPQKAVLGIFYDVGARLNNVYFPMKREEHRSKISIIQKFHYSQVSRNRFDMIAEEMDLAPSELSSFNETFNFFQIQSQGKKIKLEPLEQKTYIERDSKKSKKTEKLKFFNFSQSDTVIAISPQPHTVEICMGGVLNFLGSKKVPTFIINATSGHQTLIKRSDALAHPFLPDDLMRQIKCESSNFIESKALKTRIRECETIGAVSHLNTDAQVYNLRLPYYDMPDLRMTNIDSQIADEAIQRAMSQSHSKRVIFFIPYFNEQLDAYQKANALFMDRISAFCRKNPDQEVILALYHTPWAGDWNLYDFSYNQGSKLAALCGGELLVGPQNICPKPESLGGVFANRYKIFYFNK